MMSKICNIVFSYEGHTYTAIANIAKSGKEVTIEIKDAAFKPANAFKRIVIDLSVGLQSLTDIHQADEGLIKSLLLSVKQFEADKPCYDIWA